MHAPPSAPPSPPPPRPPPPPFSPLPSLPRLPLALLPPPPSSTLLFHPPAPSCRPGDLWMMLNQQGHRFVQVGSWLEQPCQHTARQTLALQQKTLPDNRRHCQTDTDTTRPDNASQTQTQQKKALPADTGKPKQDTRHPIQLNLRQECGSLHSACEPCETSRSDLAGMLPQAFSSPRTDPAPAAARASDQEEGVSSAIRLRAG
eukprot:2342957-Rhodomonas_salina.1